MVLDSVARAVTSRMLGEKVPFGNLPATANYERNLGRHVLLVKVARGVFQRCVETTSDLWNIEWK